MGSWARSLRSSKKSGDDTIAAELEAYECIGGDARFRSQERSHRVFIDSIAIIESLVWYDPATIRISVPPSLLFGGA